MFNVCHNIPNYQHYDQTATTVLAKAALPVTAVAGIALLTQVITVAIALGALTVATATVLVAVVARVLLNRRAIAQHAPLMARAQAWQLATARAQRQQRQDQQRTPLAVPSHIDVPAAIEATPPVIPAWATDTVKQPAERNSK